MNVKVTALTKVLKENSRFLGIAQIVLNDSLVINDVKIIQAPDSKFIAMPFYKAEDKLCDYAHAINMETAIPIKEIVLKAYMDIEEKRTTNVLNYEIGTNDTFEVTKVKIKRLGNEIGVVAIADVILNDCFALHQISFVKELSPEGRYKAKIIMPSKKDVNGNEEYIYYATNKSFLEHLTISVMNAYMEE